MKYAVGRIADLRHHRRKFLFSFLFVVNRIPVKPFSPVADRQKSEVFIFRRIYNIEALRVGLVFKDQPVFRLGRSHFMIPYLVVFIHGCQGASFRFRIPAVIKPVALPGYT